MNTAKHTPGPWVVSAGRVITTSSGQFYLTYGKDKHGNPLFKDFVELDNNTHLIAAAPAMYEAIKAALDYYRGVFTGNTVTDKMMSSKLEQALAQAGGK
jgi:hypothetical protein